MSELRVVARGAAGGAPTTFHATVREGAVGSADGEERALVARVTLRLRGEGFEYYLKLQNPGAHLVTGAWVAARGVEVAKATPLIQLFADGRFRDRFIEVRGTATLPASLQSGAVVEELQANPAAFQVILSGGSPGERWAAPLTVGR